MTTTRYFTGADFGILYTTADEISAFLIEHPDLVPDYKRTMLEVADNFAAWGDYRHMREQYMMLVDVLVAVAKAEGRRVLE